MSSTIRYLETLAANPNLAALTAEELESLMDSLQLEAPEREALLRGDAAALANLSGARKLMAAIQFPGDANRSVKKKSRVATTTSRAKASRK